MTMIAARLQALAVALALVLGLVQIEHSMRSTPQNLGDGFVPSARSTLGDRVKWPWVLGLELSGCDTPGKALSDGCGQ
jgi:hypothetical protein